MHNLGRCRGIYPLINSYSEEEMTEAEQIVGFVQENSATEYYDDRTTDELKLEFRQQAARLDLPRETFCVLKGKQERLYGESAPAAWCSKLMTTWQGDSQRANPTGGPEWS